MAKAIVGVAKIINTHPSFSVRIKENGLIRPYLKNQNKPLRRQDIEPLYFYEGSLYISTKNTLIEKKSFYHKKTLPYIMPKWKSIEIDDLEDLLTAEILFKK